MSESLEGLAVSCTRQNAGSDVYGFGGGVAGAAAPRPRPSRTTPLGSGAAPTRGAGGGVNFPGATSWALSIFTLGMFRRDMSSQFAPSAGAAKSAAPMRRKAGRKYKTGFITPPLAGDLTPVFVCSVRSSADL